MSNKVQSHRRVHVLARLSARITAVAAAAALALAVAGPASASTRQGSAGSTFNSQATDVATVSMRLDCSDMSAKAHAYAVAHGYCPADGQGATVTPNNTVYGNCGYSWLYILNLGGGYADFLYGFHSTQGAVVYRSLHVSWYNWRYYRGGGWYDTGWMASSTYSTDRRVDTYAGYVTGGLSGWVQLWWGGKCSILNPTDGETITW
jgi:hypothetical protein